MADSVKAWPGHKLFDPANYTGEEYVILFLFAFIVFVIIKHLVFHTGFYWWYGRGRFYIPNKLWSLLTGKSFCERLLVYLKSTLPEKSWKSSFVADKIAIYCNTKEFALNTGKEKGKVLEEIVTRCQPRTILIYRPNCGYVLSQILSASPPNSHVYLIEPDEEFAAFNKQLSQLIGCSDRVTLLKPDVAEALNELKKNYNRKVDFAFFNRTDFDQSTLKNVVMELEKQDLLSVKSKNYFGSIMLADKVVHIADPEFLKYVRNSKSYENKYYQFALENSPHDLVDAMECATFIGN